MEWIVILALGVWAWLQSQRLGRLERRLEELEARPFAPPVFAPAPVAERASPFAPVDDEIPEAANAEDELLLDTPLPEAVNDEIHDGDDVLVLQEPAPPLREAPRLATVEDLRPTRTNRAQIAEQWLAQNGLAWIGGGALAIGAALLVAFAAQAGFFTAPMRLGAAVLLGLALLAASEFVLRRQDNRLVASLLAGAGAAAFYVTAWAAFGLYHYIDWPIAAVLLTLCAVLLVVLSQRHGQALGALAIGAALLAPALTSADIWPSLALTTYLCLVGIGGAALAWLRRWAWAAAAVMLGLYAWFAACIAADQIPRALALIAVATLAGAVTALRKPGVEDDHGALNWRGAYVMLPAIAICVASIFMIWTWLAVAPIANQSPVGVALVSIGLVALAALAVRARAVAPATFAVAVGGAVLGVMMFMRARSYFAPGDPALYYWPGAIAAIIAAAAIGARPHRHGRVLIAASGAIGAALLMTLAAFSRSDFHSVAVWAPLFVSALLLTGAAHLAARNTARPEADWAVDAWIYAAAVLALIGVESIAPMIVRPAGHAVLSFALAFVIAWRGWRGASYAAVTAAAFALTHAISPDFVLAATSSASSITRALLFIAAATGFLFGASILAARRPSAKDASEALSSAAILAILIGLFLLLRWAALQGTAIPLDAFTENALRALMLLVAGYIVMPRHPGAGRIARWRSDVLMGAGLLFALLSAGLIHNPWWGAEPAHIAGWPVANAQLLGFAAPAALAFAASRMLYYHRLQAARIYAGFGGFFALLWAALEIRRAFHPTDMVTAGIGLLEGDCYGLVALLSALAVAVFSRLREQTLFGSDLSRITRGWAFSALAIAVMIIAAARNPWWGAHNPALSDDLIAAGATLAQALAAGLSLLLGRALSRGTGIDGARFAAAAAGALFALCFGHDVIRFLYQRGAMDDAPSLFFDIEGFWHAIWPLAFVVGGSAITQRAPGRDTNRSYIYDLEAIWSAAVWPALIWAALGLWLIFNPWWGSAPAFAPSALSALLGLLAIVLAAVFSAFAMRIPHIRFAEYFNHAAKLACAGHAFVAASLIVRRIFHGADMRALLPGASYETWSYSALWALFGGTVWAIGAMRKDATLRWIGLGLLLFVTLKVGLFDTATLSGVIRAASVIGLAVVLIVVALAARRFNGAPNSGKVESQ